MTYEELYPSLFVKNLIQSKKPPHTPEPLPWWYKPDQYCAFHQGEPNHDIENCYPLKYEVQNFVKSGMVSFEGRAPNIKANLLPANGNFYVNMVDDCPGKFMVFDVDRIQRSLVEMHRTLLLISDCEHDHDGYVICSLNPRGCMMVKRDIQKLMDEGVIQINQDRDMDPIPYVSDKVVPYKFNATMIKDGQEVPFPAANSVVSIVDVVKVTLSGCVFSPISPKVVEDVMSGESNRSKVKDDDNEVLRLIKKTEFNVVEQLLQIPSKISVLSLLMNSEEH
ncbi:hypothetical protein KIW84_012780 [Lathyrus oleraceus]|uniref:Uncharacterized protein n=1 Tax=Pisum sativum TaxID=3888 RepID=A0A9D5BIH0_PEA|nr:hypothetical protein KIW84_012780 [Pisum sativum]